MNRYKCLNQIHPEVFVFPHGQDVPISPDGFIEVSETDELSNMTLLYRGYGLVTEENPNPVLGDTNINEVMEMVYAAIKAQHEGVVSTTSAGSSLVTAPEEKEEDKKSEEEEEVTTEVTETSEDTKATAEEVVASVESAVAAAKAAELAPPTPEKKTTTRKRK